MDLSVQGETWFLAGGGVPPLMVHNGSAHWGFAHWEVTHLVRWGAELSSAQRIWVPDSGHSPQLHWASEGPTPCFTAKETWTTQLESSRAGLWSHSCNVCAPARTPRDWPMPEAARLQDCVDRGLCMEFSGPSVLQGQVCSGQLFLYLVEALNSSDGINEEPWPLA